MGLWRDAFEDHAKSCVNLRGSSRSLSSSKAITNGKVKSCSRHNLPTSLVPLLLEIYHCTIYVSKSVYIEISYLCRAAGFVKRDCICTPKKVRTVYCPDTSDVLRGIRTLLIKFFMCSSIYCMLFGFMAQAIGQPPENASWLNVSIY